MYVIYNPNLPVTLVVDIESDVIGTFPKFFSYSLSRGQWLGDDSCADILAAGLLIKQIIIKTIATKTIVISG